MKRMLEICRRLLSQYGSLLLVILATILLVGLGSQWARADSAPDSGFTSPLDPPHNHGDRPAAEIHELVQQTIDRDELTAAVLGISVEELQAARESGARLDELISQLGLDEATVHHQLQDAFTEAVQQAVDDGSLTQEQADAILAAPPPHGPDGGPQHEGRDDGGRPPHGNDDHQAPPNEGGTIPAVSGTQGDATTSATTDASQPADDSSSADAPPRAGQRGDRPGNGRDANAQGSTENPQRNERGGQRGSRGNGGRNQRSGG